MKLEIIDEKEFDKFVKNHENGSIYQLSNWGKLKESTGWKSHIVGFKEKNKIICASLLLEKKTPIKKSLFYAPRGFLIDSKNENLLKDFTTEVIKYIKERKGFLLKIDPNVVYRTRCEDTVKETTGTLDHENYLKCGFKHLGFTNDFETLQPRNLCGFKLQKTYEETLNTFQKTTRKNIEKTLAMGVKTVPINENELDDFMALLNMAGEKNDFVVRPKWYYEKMLNLFKDDVTYYITYIDTKEYFIYLNNEIKEAEKELSDLEYKFNNYNVGEKLQNQKIKTEEKLKKLNENLNYYKGKFKDQDKVNIGALMSVFVGKDGITFMSGTNPEYKSFYPKYSYYNKHIEDSIKRNKEIINFYGISGNLNKDSKYYSIYEIKKGFNPDVIELLGEYDYLINKFDYICYKIALFAYKILKKIKK